MAWYEEGRITRPNLIGSLVQSAAEHSPMAYVADHPPDVIAELRCLTSDVRTAEQMEFYCPVCSDSEFDAAEWRREQKWLYLEGLRAWAAYFG